jgi:hypothetical protein
MSRARVGEALDRRFVPPPARLLHRRCACGNHTSGHGECAECIRKKQAVPQAVATADETRSRTADGRRGHDFSRVPTNRGVHSFNGAEDEAGQESVNLDPSAPSSRAAARQQVVACPSSTRVDDVTDLTQAGVQAGYLSGYGIVARMRVLPDRTTWDGKQVTESLTQTSSTCPQGLTQPGPCSGSSTFTIGVESGGSGVIVKQPAMRNRFYDFHTSRSKSVSFLHDAGRNPAGLNACEVVCRQDYACDGVPIGTHTITRRFRKGTLNGKNVTLIDVTKDDNPAGPGDFPQRTLPRGQEYAGLAADPGEIA